MIVERAFSIKGTVRLQCMQMQADGPMRIYQCAACEKTGIAFFVTEKGGHQSQSRECPNCHVEIRYERGNALEPYPDIDDDPFRQPTMRQLHQQVVLLRQDLVETQARVAKLEREKAH